MTISGEDEAPMEGQTRVAAGSATEATSGIESALRSLATRDPTLARQLASLFTTVVSEAAKSGRFAQSLSQSLAAIEPERADAPRKVGRDTTRRSAAAGTRPKNRRLAGILDPFAVYADTGEQGLRSRLSNLGLEPLRDIVAEHGMDNDRLAMKWKDPGRVIDRIVDRVVARSAKGSAFRGDRPDDRYSAAALNRAADETSTWDAPLGATKSESGE